MTVVIREVKIDELKVDAKRFQYKIVHGKSGSTGSLREVQAWNPILGGIILVWQNEGNVFVVNDHNRYELAVRLNVKSVLCRFIQAKDSREARAIGALTNIGEGQGNSLDAAKFFRDTAYGISYLKDFGINVNLKLVKDGLLLSNLHRQLFDRTVQGDLPIERATILGNLGIEEQLRVDNLLKEQIAKKKKITNELVEEIVASVKDAYQNQSLIVDLFGFNDAVSQQKAMIRLELIAGVRKILREDSKLYKEVSKLDKVSRLEEVGNVININANQELSKQTGYILASFEQLKNHTSDVSQSIQDATERVYDGAKLKEVESDLAKQIINIISRMLPKAS